MICNGNGLCFNYDEKLLMCLFYKVIGDCCYLLKGCVSLMCEWLWL